jgi:amino acid transporter
LLYPLLLANTRNLFTMGSSEEEKQPQHDVGTEGIGSVVNGSGDFGAESELQRRLSSRHITMIALGSSIGMGLWLGSGTSLADGGPAAMFIGCEF